MNYSIVGTGAIGGFYGSKLAQSGKEVHFLLHRDYEYVREHGLQVDSVDGSFHLDNPKIYKSTADMPKTDCVIVALKTTNNHLLPDLLPPLLRKDTLVLLIQNGIGVEEDVQTMFPGQPLAAGLAFICSSKTQPGTVSHQCYGSINLANYSVPDIKQLVCDFQDAGIKAYEVEYMLGRWKKAVWNMPFNGMTVALNTQTDKLLAFPQTRQLIYDQMIEVIDTAKALGVEGLEYSFADKMIDTTIKMTPYSPSMKLDAEFHRQMEIEYLYSKPLQVARQAGCPMKKLEMLEAELRFIEHNRSGRYAHTAFPVAPYLNNRASNR